MPHFGDEQPGETHYYSPVFVYTLGIVNCGLQPMKLYAHTYFEDEGKKGETMLLLLYTGNSFMMGFFRTTRSMSRS